MHRGVYVHCAELLPVGAHTRLAVEMESDWFLRVLLYVDKQRQLFRSFFSDFYEKLPRTGSLEFSAPVSLSFSRHVSINVRGHVSSSVGRTSHVCLWRVTGMPVFFVLSSVFAFARKEQRDLRDLHPSDKSAYFCRHVSGEGRAMNGEVSKLSVLDSFPLKSS